MRYRRLGETGLFVSEIGIGGAGAMKIYGGPTDEEYAATLSKASELGINFIDTARGYERSEEMIGKAIKGRRKDWIICTKIPIYEQCNYDAALGHFQESLKALGTDYVDILLGHDVQVIGFEKFMEGGAFQAMRELKRKGKARFIGISGSPQELIKACTSDKFDVVLTFNTYNILTQTAEDDVIPIAKKNRIGIIVGGVYYQGFLFNPERKLSRIERYWYFDRLRTDSEELLRKCKGLKELFKRKGLSFKEIAVRFVISNPDISTAIIGMKNSREVEENVSFALKGTLPREIIKEIVEF